MKSILFILTVTSITLLSGCSTSNDKTPDELLNDSRMRKDIFDAILNNSDYKAEFMTKALSDKSCQAMMSKNDTLIKMVCLSEKMDSLMNKDKDIQNSVTDKVFKTMESDSVMCDHTCTRFTKNEHLKNILKSKMTDENSSKDPAKKTQH